MKEWKNVRISAETYKQLTKMGTYGDSMDDIIKKLLKQYLRQFGELKMKDK